MTSTLLPSALRSLRSSSLTSIFKSPNLNFRSPFRSPVTSIFRSPNPIFCCAMSTAPGPWLMLPPELESDGNTVYNFYSPPQNKILRFNNQRSAPITSRQTIVGSSHGWLALFNWRTSDLFLLNPITGRHVNLPPIHTVISQCHLEHGYGCVSKVITSCDDPESEECRVIIIFTVSTVDNLAFCCPTLSTEWTVIGALKRPLPRNLGGLARDYEDVVFSNKLLFCLTDIDIKELECWDVGDLHSPTRHWSNQNDLLGSWWEQAELLEKSTGLSCGPIRYLVAAPDHQLFLVMRFRARGSSSCGDPHKSIAFDVHKIDRDEDGGLKLSYVEGTGLDGLAIFVGLNHSFAVSASDHQLKPNSIYFTDTSPTLPHFKYGGHDIGIFDYESRTVSPCYYPCENESFKKIVPGPVWFTPTQSQ